MNKKCLVIVCSLAIGSANLARADGTDDALKAMKKQIDELQAQIKRLEQKQAQPQAAAPAAPAGGGEYLQRKEGDGFSFITRGGGEVTVYGNLDVSLDSTTKGISDLRAGNTGFGVPGDGVLGPLGGTGWMPAISTNLSYIGVRGFQKVGDLPFNFVYQLETQIDISATSGTTMTNSNTSDQVKGGITSRNSYIGIASPTWGAVKIGKTDAPYKMSTARMNAFSGMLGDYSVIMGNTGGDNRVEFGTRLDHALWYESPSWSGVTFNALWAPGQNRAGDNSNLAAGESDCAGGNIPGSGGLAGACNDGSYGTAYSMSLNYSGPVYLTMAYEMHKYVNRTSDLGVGPGTFDPNDIADEDAGKVGIQYTFKSTGTTVNGIWEKMRRSLPAYLEIQNERNRTGYWFAVSQDLGEKDSLHFGWAHANSTPGDPGQHNTIPLVGIGNPNPDNSANMYTVAWKHKLDRQFSYYATYATTVNHGLAHYDLGAGGRAVTTDCHDASNTDTTGTDPAGGAPRCWAGGRLQGASVGLKYTF